LTRHDTPWNLALGRGEGVEGRVCLLFVLAHRRRPRAPAASWVCLAQEGAVGLDLL